ncbi:hypothetical protein HWN40_12280 [Methanolobus zinderi]|jgi:hypothetical protein|uniref:Uncharacterized protein n=1 Tax=Methanolobus zinderi TaxID=536044 RepID=A0A7D5E7M1_9EURY|nr:hypothetical protein [Methanolobus zinderi]KXS44611.1 MAG: hypothetical protein AWU59_427 [Methanolobus sp. T82-4]QLC50952.1 hypothetical protein HWN40_12280 [Methanolobus zinderi]
MDKNKILFLSAFAFILIVGGTFAGTGYLDGLIHTEPDVNINSSQAVSIVKSDSNASEFIENKFKVSDWRATKTTFMEQTTEDQNNTLQNGADRFWKVEIMERTCACPGTSTLYVVEAYVDADTGDLISVETMRAPEKDYEKTTCSSTSCH